MTEERPGFHRTAWLAAVMAIASAVSPAAAQVQSKPRVETLDFEGDGDRVDFTIAPSESVQYTYFELDGPRLVLDLHGTENQLGFESRTVGIAGVLRVRAAQFEDESRNVTRVVFDLEEGTSYAIDRADDGLMTVSFDRQASEAVPATTEVAEDTAIEDGLPEVPEPATVRQGKTESALSTPTPGSTMPIPASGTEDRVRLDVVDGRISLTAEAVPLSDLLRMFDQAIGTESTVAEHLRSRNISVSFVGLDFGDAVRKIFEGQSLDYAVLGRDRIMVTAESGIAPPRAEAMTRTAPGAATAATTRSTATPREGINQPPNPFQLQQGAQPGAQQPINTPFGQIFNQQGNQPGRPTPVVPGNTPVQPSPLFGNSSPTPFGNQTPATSPATPTPRPPLPTPVQPRP